MGVKGGDGRPKQGENRRFRLEEAVLLGTTLPLEGFLSEPVAFSKAAQVDRLSIGWIFPGHINLAKKMEKLRRGVWQARRWDRSVDGGGGA